MARIEFEFESGSSILDAANPTLEFPLSSKVSFLRATLLAKLAGDSDSPPVGCSAIYVD